MVIASQPGRRLRTRGSLSVELTVAVGILVAAVLPLSVSFVREQRMARGLYHRAVALEIVDGEMEALVAGEWRAFTPGRQPYPVRAEAAKNLPPGAFILTLTHDRARLEWVPETRGVGGAVAREVILNTAPEAAPQRP
jgi:hypothetical protein